MRVLVWQWGRRGAGPRFAAELARNFAAVPETEMLLSLAAGAEIPALGRTAGVRPAVPNL